MKIDLFPAGQYLYRKCREHGEKVFIKEYLTSRICSYSGFWKEIETSTFFLHGNGVSCGDRIMIIMDNSITSLSMFFGAIVAGIIPVPVSPKASVSELSLLVYTSSATCLLASSGLSEYQELKNVKVLNMNSSVRTIRDKMVFNEKDSMSDTVYVMYTSGSSGTPKEIVITHDNMLSELFSMVDAYELDDSHRHLCILPVYHASALYRNILLPFHNGSEVVLLEGFDSDNFWKLVRNEQINFVQVVPSILSELLMKSDKFTPEDQACLTFIGSASAPHPQELVSRFEQTFGVYVLQAYGMTEATCTITLNPLKREDRNLGSVGRPISVNNITILDDSGKPLPAGEIGRVIVSGRNVALNVSSALTENGINTNGNVLETGDLGYIDEEGYLWLVGRQTDMIKRGGYRISPGEIENQIMKILSGVEVAVIGVPHPLLGQDIIAFITVGKEVELDNRALLRELKKTMASYKMPSQLIYVDFIPKLTVGKVNRMRLIEDYKNTVK